MNTKKKEETKLEQLTVSDGRDIYDMLQRIEKNENSFLNDANGLSYEQYKEWIVEKDRWSRGEMLPEGYVKQWVYWLKDKNVPVGFGKIREKLTENSLEWGGNIGFSIDPLHRGEGYGNIILQLLLDRAYELGIKKVLSTVKSSNIVSRKVHEKMGGKLIDERNGIMYFEFSSQSQL